MISDLDVCARCGERPRRLEVLEHGADVWWLVGCDCGDELIHVVGDGGLTGADVSRLAEIAPEILTPEIGRGSSLTDARWRR